MIFAKMPRDLTRLRVKILCAHGRFTWLPPAQCISNSRFALVIDCAQTLPEAITRAVQQIESNDEMVMFRAWQKAMVRRLEAA